MDTIPMESAPERGQGLEGPVGPPVIYSLVLLWECPSSVPAMIRDLWDQPEEESGMDPLRGFWALQALCLRNGGVLYH